MKVVVILPNYQHGDFEQFFKNCFSLVELLEEMARRSLDLTVVTRASLDAELWRNGVCYRFVKVSRSADLRSWQVPYRFASAIAQLDASVVHIHGLSCAGLILAIRQLVGRRVMLVGEFHSDSLRSGVSGWLQRLALSRLDLLLFSNTLDADRWRAWLGSERTVIAHSIEASSLFSRKDRAAARELTGLQGRPVFLWNSRLIPRRHPLTVLSGFGKALEMMGEAHLYMMIPDAEPGLLEQVRQKLQCNPVLQRSVTLMLGRRPYVEMEPYYNSADYLLSGSTGDAYGFGAADAMACGVIPIAPDLPTFQDITDQGRIGGLWQLGDDDSLAATILQVVADSFADIEAASENAAHSFAKRLSYPVIADNLIALYESGGR